jgi:hypothetical protein
MKDRFLWTILVLMILAALVGIVVIGRAGKECQRRGLGAPIALHPVTCQARSLHPTRPVHP